MSDFTPDIRARICSDIGINNKYTGQLVYCVPFYWAVYFKQDMVQEDEIDLYPLFDPQTSRFDYNSLIILSPLLFKCIPFLYKNINLEQTMMLFPRIPFVNSASDSSLPHQFQLKFFTQHRGHSCVLILP